MKNHIFVSVYCPAILQKGLTLFSVWQIHVCRKKEMCTKVLFETLTPRGQSGSVVILLNCVLVKCCNDTSRSSTQVARLCTSGDKHADSTKLSATVVVIRNVRCNAIL